MFPYFLQLIFTLLWGARLNVWCTCSYLFTVQFTWVLPLCLSFSRGGTFVSVHGSLGQSWVFICQNPPPLKWAMECSTRCDFQLLGNCVAKYFMSMSVLPHRPPSESDGRLERHKACFTTLSLLLLLALRYTMSDKYVDKATHVALIIIITVNVQYYISCWKGNTFILGIL